MKSRMIRKLAVLGTGAALALSLPVASAVGDQGGVPNSNSTTCPSKAKGHGPKKSAKNDNGRKCGFHRGETR
jgi:hypothetical protein